MKVYMLKDVENVGMAGQIVRVKEGYAKNFLLPRKVAVEVTAKNEQFYKNREVKIAADAQELSSKMGMLAQHIKSMHITIKKKTHDDGKLYGAVSADDIIAALKSKDVSIQKKQVVFGKSIKAAGEHKVEIKLSSKLRPEVTVKVVGE